MGIRKNDAMTRQTPPNAGRQPDLPPRENKQCPQVYRREQANLYLGDFSEVSKGWPSPTVIVADGPYGVASYPGDPASHEDLAEWYSPHIAHWSKRALPETTLWFWNTEIGWASVHPILASHGWEYRSCHVWDKGLGHIAGNANSKTLRRFPVVTEVCVQYVRRVTVNADGRMMSLKEWIRHEWERSGLPFSESNLACGVKNAATRKYLTKCHLWYSPPPESFELLAQYANRYGRSEGKPYFSLDGIRPATAETWGKMRAKFHCEVGITNVWREPQVRGEERIKDVYKSVHINQKPLRLLELMIRASSDPGDVIWEPFGGLCSTAVAALNTGRQCYSAEILESYYRAARNRLEGYDTA